MPQWIDDKAMPADRVVGTWNQEPSFAGLAPDPTQRRDALDKARLVIGIEGRDDDPVITMETLEFLSVPHMRLAAGQCDAHHALVGIRIIVAKCAIRQAPLIGGE